MTRFRLSLESLDARTLPSAVFATPEAPTAHAAHVADASGTPADTGETATTAGKVSMQDFSFVMKVNKSSPLL